MSHYKMKKCRVCEKESPNEMFAKKQGRCNPCRAALKRKRGDVHKFYKTMVCKVPELFINDNQLRELEERTDIKLWPSRDCPPPLDKEMLVWWQPEIEKRVGKGCVLHR